jgi:hypothetical protein
MEHEVVIMKSEKSEVKQTPRRGTPLGAKRGAYLSNVDKLILLAFMEKKEGGQDQLKLKDTFTLKDGTLIVPIQKNVVVDSSGAPRAYFVKNIYRHKMRLNKLTKRGLLERSGTGTKVRYTLTEHAISVMQDKVGVILASAPKTKVVKEEKKTALSIIKDLFSK